jgi:hypothetical protein
VGAGPHRAPARGRPGRRGSRGKPRAALPAKAKGAPGYRLDALYDQVYHRDVRPHACRSCRARDGAAGVGGLAFPDIERYGLGRWLGAPTEGLPKGTDRPPAVRRVYLPELGGKQRPLGIPTTKGRVVRAAARLASGPAVGAGRQPERGAYRPGRSALGAPGQVQALLGGRPHEA